MTKDWYTQVVRRLISTIVLMGAVVFAIPCSGQQITGGTSVNVTKSSNELSLIAGDTNVLTMEYDVPRLVVGNPEVVRATPIAANQISITALKTGVTSISLSNEQGQVQTISLQVLGDVRELQEHLNRVFPRSAIHAQAVRDTILLTGHVSRDQDIENVTAIARQFSPTVLNQCTVGASQKVALQVKVVEVSRTKLRKHGIDWTLLTSDFRFVSGVSGLVGAATGAATGGATMRFNVLDGSNEFTSFIDILEQNNLAKILADTTLTATSGRPASFISGGQVPVPINTGLGVQSVEFQDFGTQLDFLPIVLGENQLRLEVRPEVKDLAGDLRDPVTGVPGFRVRRVDTGVEMRAGQTLALAGLIQNRVDVAKRGLPVLMHMPLIGGAFRRVEETYNEVELIILVTPQFIHEVDDSQIPTLPGRGTVSPSTTEMFRDGYIEVPNCNNPYELGNVVPRTQGGYGMMPANSGTAPFYPANSDVQSLPTNMQAEIQRMESLQSGGQANRSSATSQEIKGESIPTQNLGATKASESTQNSQSQRDLYPTQRK
jgi:pilus assembly protein CpaC